MARTRDWLSTGGWRVDVVERQCGPIKRDLFGIFDLLAYMPGQIAVLGIQVTSASNHAARSKKLSLSSELRDWLRSGHGAWVVSWKMDADSIPRVEQMGWVLVKNDPPSEQ